MRTAKRALVWARAKSRCEYCRMLQDDDPFPTFHVEHIIARKHGGGDHTRNLALSGHYCNLGKGPNLSGIDSVTRKTVPLFHPRLQRWSRHFRWGGSRIVG